MKVQVKDDFQNCASQTLSAFEAPGLFLKMKFLFRIPGVGLSFSYLSSFTIMQMVMAQGSPLRS
jgi:hypothetical protein